MELPIIDISPFLNPSSSTTSRSTCAQSIHQACLTYGFLYISNTGLSPAELARPLDVTREFFLTPQEEKNALRIRKGDRARGYQLLGENVTQYKADHHEGWDAYKPFPPSEEDASVLLHGPNLWPTNPSTFKPTMEDWVEKMNLLGLALLEATAMGLGVDMEGEEWVQLKSKVLESFWVMRAIAYPPLPKDAEGISCGTHADYGNFTLHGTKGALQVFIDNPLGPDEERGRNGIWLNADPIPNTFVVNIGEMWEVWSNGLYKATLHRVIHKGQNMRVSLPFFSEPNWDALIEPLPAALRLQSQLEGSPLSNRRKPVVYGDFLIGKVSGNFSIADAK